jgi:Uma2 family endonuclease
VGRGVAHDTGSRCRAPADARRFDPLPRRADEGRGPRHALVSYQCVSHEDYRIPDLTFVAGGRESILAEDGLRGEGPDAVIEIRSPHDETYDKLPFYAAIGTREGIIIDRDTKRPELLRLAGNQYVAVQHDRDGWLLAETLQIRFRVVGAAPPRLAVEDAVDPTFREEI